MRGRHFAWGQFWRGKFHKGKFSAHLQCWGAIRSGELQHGENFRTKLKNKNFPTTLSPYEIPPPLRDSPGTLSGNLRVGLVS